MMWTCINAWKVTDGLNEKWPGLRKKKKRMTRNEVGKRSGKTGEAEDLTPEDAVH
jgi:hypothetical protein